MPIVIIYTDNPACADRFLEGREIAWKNISRPEDGGISALANRIFGSADLFFCDIDFVDGWNYLFIAKTAPESQYDILIELGREGVPIPHGTLCLAGEGRKFHGFKGRHWDSPKGNLYLSAHFAPQKPVANYGPGFMVLAAVSVIDAIDGIPELSGQSAIKWVNDILIDDAKVCGVLAHTIAESDIVTNAIIGIGLNVEVSPDPIPTIFVPRAASLNDFAQGPGICTRGRLFGLLTRSIYQNYLALSGGDYHKLLAKYRDRSNIMGRRIEIYEDSESDTSIKVAEGRISSIGEILELYLEGRETPVKRGRLAFKK
jgi:BirA family biotin operon repressor/biotin-[acetyl-CoA-carboxylase] ligase